MATDWRCPEHVAALDSHETATGVPDVPRGVRVGLLRECAAAGCGPCRDACQYLDDHLDGRSPDGEHRDVTSFQEASEA